MSAKHQITRRAIATVNRFATNSKLVLLPKTDEPAADAPDVYAQDGLLSAHNHEFLTDPAFVRAYQRGVRAGGFDYKWHWRVHVGLWVARQAARVGGNYVECGVGRGFMSSAVLTDLPWAVMSQDFYLFDTYEPRNPQTPGIRAEEHYAPDIESVRANFAEWPRVHVIQGLIPDSLHGCDTGPVGYLHLDLNSAEPEVAALRYLWPRLLSGAWLLFDDYGYSGFRPQKIALDEAAAELTFDILSLPTGQGLAVKP